ncbi:unnamed protein product [Ambrosiozyma monospora]|uniref:Unnamed protein product n=1 Tax=Ambrosiozyma monospora TaxID=43982 RepID=A0ACB5SUE1_AMBMO|nr:unnamed protein product [Ambrosiozyma monospora]
MRINNHNSWFTFWLLAQAIFTCGSNTTSGDEGGDDDDDNAMNYTTSIYYSEWTYHRLHSPSDILLSHVTTIYYAFAKMDTFNLDLKFENETLATGEKIPFTAEKYKISSEDKCELKEIDTIPVKQLTEDESHNSTGLLGQLSQMKKLNPKLKVLLSIGGSDSNKDFTKLTKTKSHTKKFVTNAISFLKKYEFDGIDIDWEYPNSQEAKGKLNNLVTEFDNQFSDSDNLDSEGNKYHLTIAVPSSKSQLAYYDFASMQSKITQFNLMGYDQKGVWSKYSGYQSNLYEDPKDPESSDSVNGTVHYLLSKSVPANKIVLGMPAYGRSFNTSKLYSKFKGCASIDGIQQDEEECIVNYRYLPPKGYKEYYDEVRVAAYAISSVDDHNGQGKEHKTDHDDSAGGEGNVEPGVLVYDNEMSARAKAQYVRKMGLGGGMWWDSDGDAGSCKRSLLMHFVDELGGVKKLGVVSDKGNDNNDNDDDDGDDDDDDDSGNGSSSNSSKSGACAVVKKPALVVIFGNVMFALLLSLIE